MPEDESAAPGEPGRSGEPAPERREGSPEVPRAGQRPRVTRRVVRDVDPEDWAAGGDSDDRYLRERPPHWE